MPPKEEKITIRTNMERSERTSKEGIESEGLPFLYCSPSCRRFTTALHGRGRSQPPRDDTDGRQASLLAPLYVRAAVDRGHSRRQDCRRRRQLRHSRRLDRRPLVRT